MGVQRRARIVDADGVLGYLRSVDAADPKHPVGVIHLTGGARVRVPFDLLEHHQDGGYSTRARWSDFVRITDDAASIPVIEERVNVAVKAAPERLARVRRRVVSEERVVEVPVWRERFEVERVPVNAFVDRAPEPYHDGDTLIIPCTEEVPVVEVRLRVREELRIRVVRERHVHRETITVRRHDIDVDTSSSEQPELKPRDNEEP